jgi:hypothetical protein
MEGKLEIGPLNKTVFAWLLYAITYFILLPCTIVFNLVTKKIYITVLIFCICEILSTTDSYTVISKRRLLHLKELILKIYKTFTLLSYLINFTNSSWAKTYSIRNYLALWFLSAGHPMCWRMLQWEWLVKRG